MSSITYARSLMLLGTALTGSAIAPSSHAFAQSASGQEVWIDQNDAAVADANAQNAASTDAEIIVTGSRIRQPDYRSPNPVVSASDEDIRRSGSTNLTNFLRRVPALTNSQDSTRSAGNAQADGAIGQAGLNLLDLRGLGTNRTLVLVNGRRHVASQFDTAAVDINTIPTDLVQRVDVLTGAASAIYGADGVSGVVNFILRRDFDGIAARGQLGISEEGDAANRFGSIIVGRNFADGRGNVTLAYEYDDQDPLANDDRDFLRSPNRVFFVNNANYVAEQAGSFQKIPVRDNRYAGGYFDGDGVLQPGGSYANIIKVGDQFFRGDGQPYTFGTFPDTFDYSQGGDDTPVAGYIGDILPRTLRHAGNLLASFEFSPAFRLSFEGKYVSAQARTLSSYSGTYFVPIQLDNPFLPTTIRDAAIANGDTQVFINRNNFDLPRRGEDDLRETWRGVIAATGTLSEHSAYDLSYTYGRTDIGATKLNDRVPSRSSEALDAIRLADGSIVCRSVTARAAGCVPLNTFGTYVADPASFAYVYENPESRARVEQHVANATLTGDFGALFTLPGGPIRFAVGAEYREESSRFDPAEGLTNGRYYSPADGIYDEPLTLTASRGRFDVWELFGEVSVPILADVPFAQDLSVGAAGRYSDYSTVGDTNAYQFNAIWSPIADITFRGSYGRSVRAPNIAELFRPTTGLSDFIEDPCYLPNRNQGSASRAANCVAIITAAGGNPATFAQSNNPDANVNIVGVESGNPNLDPEVARTWTAGVVLRPSFLPRLQIGADWYDIDLTGAINRASPTDLARLCVDLASTDNPYCAAISRRQGTGYIDGYTVSPQNVAAFRTAGLELNASYNFELAGAGELDLRLIGGYLHRLEQIPLPGADVRNNSDLPFRPRYTLTFSPSWTIDALTVAYTLRWQNGVRRFDRIETDGRDDYVDPRFFRFKELWQHDLQLDYRVNERFGFYGGVTNLGNQRPDIGFETNVPISPLGRYFYVGARVTRF